MLYINRYKQSAIYKQIPHYSHLLIANHMYSMQNGCLLILLWHNMPCNSIDNSDINDNTAKSTVVGRVGSIKQPVIILAHNSQQQQVQGLKKCCNHDAAGLPSGISATQLE